MLERVVAERPQWLVLPGQQKPSLDLLWFGSTGNDPLAGINAGVVGLAVNLVINIGLRLLRPADAPPQRLAVDKLGELAAPSARS